MHKVNKPSKTTSAAERRMGVGGGLTQMKAVKRNNLRVKRKATRG